MLDLKVIFSNGDFSYTKINSTEEEAKKYYVGKIFNIGSMGDNLQKCTAIEIL